MRNKVLNLKTFDLLNFHCLTHSAVAAEGSVMAAEANEWYQTFLNQWKTGKDAELHLVCDQGRLKLNMTADLGLWQAPVWGPTGQPWGHQGLMRESPSKERRRARRAAERAAAEEAAAKEAAAAVEVVTVMKVADGCKAVEVPKVAVKVADVEEAEKVAKVADVAKIVEEAEIVPEKHDTENIQSEHLKDVGLLSGACLPSTSRVNGNKPVMTCWNCEEPMSSTHQCCITLTSPVPTPLAAPAPACSSVLATGAQAPEIPQSAGAHFPASPLPSQSQGVDVTFSETGRSRKLNMMKFCDNCDSLYPVATGCQSCVLPFKPSGT